MVNNNDGDLLIPLVLSEEPLKYKNMDRIDSGILAFPKEFWGL